MTKSKLFRELITVGFLLSVGLTKAKAAASPSLNFSPANTTVNAGETFLMDILLDTAGRNAGGAGAKVNFNPNQLKAIEIIPGDIFADYPAAVIDNDNGRLTISGIAASSQNLFTGVGVFARINFTALTPGPANLNFEFQPGSTTDSNIATMEPPGDILAQVNQSTITINQAGSGFDGTETDQDGNNNEPDNQDSYFTEAATPAEKDSGGTLEKWWKTITTNLPWIEETVTSARNGRPESINLDPLKPLPRQQAITDTSQTQPQKIQIYAAENQTKKWTDVLRSKEFLIPVFIGLLIIAVLILLRKYL
jgi:hypothetical protein